MSKGKKGKRNKIKRNKIGKKTSKVALKKKKGQMRGKRKNQAKDKGLFQAFFESYENFKKNRKVENATQVRFGGKEREKQIKEEQRKLEEDEKELQAKEQ